ncbi:hypothetical protein CBS147332_9183 [Penicillium roqueforti]|nr:hypothetical protein CBS147355_8122 [Penicillium roqueforti]KAI2696094.1 hypothetical protein CBS147332_9183 [Penicillium roqueforti]KAI2709529.1 hypothetical protein CBS147318_9139 [Penicillium roqueforti]KAI3099248.1 hypothetical protein CBS147331_8658 [Penicillium roqueforti]KAI3159463.1 hypothetical protein DTO039G3_9354 [Penicillium roqueforti]
MEYLGSIRAQESMTCHHLTKLLTQMSRNCPRYRISNPGKPVSSSSLDLNLIDIISKHQHIPRPTLDHIKYENWLKWSQNLSKWLILTDEAYLAIINLLPDAEDTESRAFMKLWTMRWYQFRSFHAFVSTCRAQASICKEVSYCWLPTLLILHELKGEMPDLAHYINFQIGESPDEPERTTNPPCRGFILSSSIFELAPACRRLTTVSCTESRHREADADNAHAAARAGEPTPTRSFPLYNKNTYIFPVQAI